MNVYYQQTFHISHVCISQKVKGALMENVQHIIFIMKTKILAYFQICISVPLNTGMTDKTFQQSGKQDSLRHILKSSGNM